MSELSAPLDLGIDNTHELYHQHIIVLHASVHDVPVVQLRYFHRTAAAIVVVVVDAAVVEGLLMLSSKVDGADPC